MRIKDVENLTGLTRKSIRFYESRGLLNVKRSENSYREYDESVVQQLQAIAVLRKAGVAISDIQLWIDEVITLEEMLHKRLSELKDHTELAASQTSLCQELLISGDIHGIPAIKSENLLDEEDHMTESAPDAQLCLGLDIGTSTISSVILDLSVGATVAAYTIKNDADLSGTHPCEKCQDVRKIDNRVEKLVDSLLSRYPTIRSIGFTGQMHGILYLDTDNHPCSPLYTWQDSRAGQGTPSTCDLLTSQTGLPISPGYGFATHCHLVRTGSLSASAAKLCTIMDYSAWKLCGFQNLVMHSSNAASLGFYNLNSNQFDPEALAKVGINPNLLPGITSGNDVIGTYRGIPVSVAIGDNQSSFLGTVEDHTTMALANFGTGSQISLLADAATVASYSASGDIEIRPFLENTYIISGSALCGGRAYALVEQFFRSFLTECGMTDAEQYKALNQLALRGLDSGNLPAIRTTFCGTRGNPALRGEITSLSEDNFTPAAFAAGTLIGMSRELLDMYNRMPGSSVRRLVASGNAVRKNPALKRALEQVFAMKICIPVHREEAAFGAAMFSALAAELIKTPDLSQKCIHYQAQQEESSWKTGK